MKTILIVDDETIITKALFRALDKEHFQVLTAPDGKKGLELILKKQPDLVLLDIIMPGLSGIEVLEKMRRSHIDTPVILMTAYGDASTEKKAKGLNAAYLTKPFKRIDDVISIVKSKLSS